MHHRIERRNRAPLAVAHRAFAEARTSPRRGSRETAVSGTAQTGEYYCEGTADAARRGPGAEPSHRERGRMDGTNVSGTLQRVCAKAARLRATARSLEAF